MSDSGLSGLVKQAAPSWVQAPDSPQQRARQYLRSLDSIRKDYIIPEARPIHDIRTEDVSNLLGSRPVYSTRPLGARTSWESYVDKLRANNRRDRMLPEDRARIKPVIGDSKAGWPAGSHGPIDPGPLSTSVPKTLPTKIPFTDITLIPGSSGGRRGLSDFYPGKDFADSFSKRHALKLPTSRISPTGFRGGGKSQGGDFWRSYYNTVNRNIAVPEGESWSKSDLPIVAHEIGHMGAAPYDMAQYRNMLGDGFPFGEYDKFVRENSNPSLAANLLAGPTLARLGKDSSNNFLFEQFMDKNRDEPWVEQMGTWQDKVRRDASMWTAQNPLADHAEDRIEELNAMTQENATAMGLGWDPRKAGLPRSSLGIYDKLKKLAWPNGAPKGFGTDGKVTHDAITDIGANLHNPNTPLGKEYIKYLQDSFPGVQFGRHDSPYPSSGHGARLRPVGDSSVIKPYPVTRPPYGGDASLSGSHLHDSKYPSAWFNKGSEMTQSGKPTSDQIELSHKWSQPQWREFQRRIDENDIGSMSLGLGGAMEWKDKPFLKEEVAPKIRGAITPSSSDIYLKAGKGMPPWLRKWYDAAGAWKDSPKR